MKKLFRVVAVVAAVFAISCAPQGSSTAVAQSGIERVKPAEVGMDEARLAKVDDIINASIANKEIPGAVLSVVNTFGEGGPSPSV